MVHIFKRYFGRKQTKSKEHGKRKVYLWDKVPSTCVFMTAHSWLSWHLIAKAAPAVSFAQQKIRMVWKNEVHSWVPEISTTYRLGRCE